MHGEANPGDPDLYVRFDQDPATNAYDCRPYLTGAEETCSLDVPANATTAHVGVRGYSAAHYSLTVTRTPVH
jgi:serine protease